MVIKEGNIPPPTIPGRSEYFVCDYQIWSGGGDGDNDKRMIRDPVALSQLSAGCSAECKKKSNLTTSPIC